MRKKCHKRENERIFFAVQKKKEINKRKKLVYQKKIFKKENSFNIRMRKRVKEVEKNLYAQNDCYLFGSETASGSCDK